MRRSRVVLSLLAAMGAGLLLVLLNGTGDAHGPRSALEDRGAAADIASARASVPVVLAASGAAARTPAPAEVDVGRLEGTLLSQEAAAGRYEYMLSYLTPEKAAEVAPGVEEGLRQNLLDPRFAASAYSDNRFVASRFEGVQVDGDRALVIVRGRHEHLGHGGQWRSTDEAQHVVELVRDPDAVVGWLLDEVTSVPVT